MKQNEAPSQATGLDVTFGEMLAVHFAILVHLRQDKCLFQLLDEAPCSLMEVEMLRCEGTTHGLYFRSRCLFSSHSGILLS